MTNFVDTDNGSSLKDICRRVINFDIDQNLLKANYPYSSKIHGPKTYTNAYGKIQKYMESHGFSHRQYSTYDSDIPISLDRVYAVVSGLVNYMPYLPKCFQKIDVTDIGKQYDLTKFVNDCASQQLSKEKTNVKEEKTSKLGVHHPKAQKLDNQR